MHFASPGDEKSGLAIVLRVGRAALGGFEEDFEAAPDQTRVEAFGKTDRAFEHEHLNPHFQFDV